MSVSPSPDGDWLTFDLLGHIYRLDLGVKMAKPLTQGSGIALNFHPTISPDGKKIAFVSDRLGQDGLWIMNADGNAPKLLFMDPNVRFTDPVWTPDGKAIIAVRHSPTPGRGWHRRNTKLWYFPLNGSPPKELLGGTLTQFNSPSISSDGVWLYYHQSYFSGNRFGTQSGHHLRRLSLKTGAVEIISNTVTEDEKAESFQVKSPSEMPKIIVSEIAPEVSPDGQHIIFAREINSGTMSFKGHNFTPTTGFFLKNIETGKEKFLTQSTKDLTSAHGIYSYRVLPGYGWSKDGKSLIYSEGGKIKSYNIKSGKEFEIPFTARVKRKISERVRGKVNLDGREVQSRYLQWPASSPDGKKIVFVAFGQIWQTDFKTGKSKALVTPSAGVRLLTPIYSANAQKIYYTSWNDQDGGDLWQYDFNSNITKASKLPNAKYIYPEVSKDTKKILINKGSLETAWLTPKDWELVEADIETGQVKKIVQLPFFQRIFLGKNDRIYYQYQKNAHEVSLYPPFPFKESLESYVYLRSLQANGKNIQNHIKMAPIEFGGFALDSEVKVSPNGKWVSFVSSNDIYITDFSDLPKDENGLPFLDTNPNNNNPKIKRLTELGGSYSRWRYSGDIEWMSGHRYQKYNPEKEYLFSKPIEIKIERSIGQGDILFRNAGIITMNGDQVLNGADLLIEKNRISCLGTCLTPKGAKIIDATGKVIIPGLVDVHAHNLGQGSYSVNWPVGRLNLAYGVTTTVDPATLSQSLFPIADMVEAGVMVGPRSFGTAELVVKPGLSFGGTLDVSSYEDAQRNVKRRADWGAISIKNFRLNSRQANQMLIEATREAGLSITAEGGPLYFDLGFAMDGQTGWEHSIAQLPIYSDVAKFLGKAGVVYSPTILVAGHRGGSMDYFRPKHDFKGDEKYLSLLEPEVKEDYLKRPTLTQRPLSAMAFPIQAQGLADIIREGGRGAIGEHSEQPGLGHHWEIWSYAAALTPMEALKVATYDGAWFIGLDHEIGSISEGKLADLVVLNSNPLHDIKNTLDIQYIMKQGLLYDGSSLELLNSN
ncbi:MAG: amidohydrolase family protein [Sphingomonadales bacterium]